MNIATSIGNIRLSTQVAVPSARQTPVGGEAAPAMRPPVSPDDELKESLQKQLRKFKDEWTCMISHDVTSNPVQLRDEDEEAHGQHIFDNNTIQTWLYQHNTNPCTRKTVVGICSAEKNFNTALNELYKTDGMLEIIKEDDDQALLLGAIFKSIQTEKTTLFDLLRESPTDEGRTAHKEKVTALIKENPILIDATDNEGYTPLHWAAQKGHIDIAKALIDKGAEVNVQNQWGKTPLHGTAQNGHIDIAKALLDAGADVNIQNRWGETPLIVARFKSPISFSKLFPMIIAVASRKRSAQEAAAGPKKKTRP